jgi:hypothetical protein
MTNKIDQGSNKQGKDETEKKSSDKEDPVKKAERLLGAIDDQKTWGKLKRLYDNVLKGKTGEINPAIKAELERLRKVLRTPLSTGKKSDKDKESHEDNIPSHHKEFRDGIENLSEDWGKETVEVAGVMVPVIKEKFFLQCGEALKLITTAYDGLGELIEEEDDAKVSEAQKNEILEKITEFREKRQKKVLDAENVDAIEAQEQEDFEYIFRAMQSMVKYKIMKQQEARDKNKKALREAHLCGSACSSKDGTCERNTKNEGFCYQHVALA